MALKFHPLADVLPLIEGAEFDRLVADITEQRLYRPAGSSDLVAGKYALIRWGTRDARERYGSEWRRSHRNRSRNGTGAWRNTNCNCRRVSC
jgi:hypothetical protein